MAGLKHVKQDQTYLLKQQMTGAICALTGCRDDDDDWRAAASLLVGLQNDEEQKIKQKTEQFRTERQKHTMKNELIKALWYPINVQKQSLDYEY